GRRGRRWSWFLLGRTGSVIAVPERVFDFVAQQVRVAAADQIHQDLAEPAEQQDEAYRHDEPRHPLRNGDGLGEDADLEHLFDIDPASHEYDDCIDQAEQGGDDFNPVRNRARQQLDERIDPDMGAYAYPV